MLFYTHARPHTYTHKQVFTYKSTHTKYTRSYTHVYIAIIIFTFEEYMYICNQYLLCYVEKLNIHNANKTSLISCNVIHTPSFI